jgi:hypothetical protein
MNGYVVVNGSEIAAFVQDMYSLDPAKRQTLVKQVVEDFLVWRFKRNGPAATGIAPDRGSQSPQGNLNMNTDTTAAGARQAEHPAYTLRRLADEMAITMSLYPEAPSCAVIFPAGKTDYPVLLMMCRDYSEITKATFAYREAHREKVRLYHETFRPGEVVPLPEKPQHKAYWDAFHKASQAHMALMDAFDDVGTLIEGDAA